MGKTDKDYQSFLRLYLEHLKTYGEVVNDESLTAIQSALSIQVKIMSNQRLHDLRPANILHRDIQGSKELLSEVQRANAIRERLNDFTDKFIDLIMNTFPHFSMDSYGILDLTIKHVILEKLINEHAINSNEDSYTPFTCGDYSSSVLFEAIKQIFVERQPYLQDDCVVCYVVGDTLDHAWIEIRKSDGLIRPLDRVIDIWSSKHSPIFRYDSKFCQESCNSVSIYVDESNFEKYLELGSSISKLTNDLPSNLFDLKNESELTFSYNPVNNAIELYDLKELEKHEQNEPVKPLYVIEDVELISGLLTNLNSFCPKKLEKHFVHDDIGDISDESGFYSSKSSRSFFSKYAKERAEREKNLTEWRVNFDGLIKPQIHRIRIR